MTYPWGDCDTYKAVTMDHITLRNITSRWSLLPAGVILCNDTNPCTNFHFEDVSIKTPLWDVLGYGWITQYAEGTSIRTFPDPKFKPVGYYNDPKNRVLDSDRHDLQTVLSAESMLNLLWTSVFGGDADIE